MVMIRSFLFNTLTPPILSSNQHVGVSRSTMLNVPSLEGAAEIEAATVIAKMVNAVKNFMFV